MHRQLRGRNRHTGGALAFEGRPHLAMQPHARGRRRAVVQHLAEQRMLEGIRQLQSIAPFPGTGQREPYVLAHQLIAGQGHRGDVEPQGERQRFDPELDPADRGRGEQRALLAAEPGDVVVDDGRQVLGHGNRREARLRRFAVIGAFHHLRDDRRDEQRHAVGALVQRTDEGLIGRERRRMPGDVGGDLGLGEGVEQDLLAQAVQAQLTSQGVERMVRRDHLGHAKGREPHQASAAAPPRDVVDELDRRAVAPVQVLRHQQQGALVGVAVQQLAHLPQHAVRAYAGQFSPQCVAFLGGAEPRQLQQPGRPDRAQQRGQVRVLAAQLSQSLQHRQIGLAGAVVLDALAARHGDASQARHEVLDQHGLADARFAGHPHHRPLPAAGLAPGAAQPRDRIGTTDERRRFTRAGKRADGGRVRRHRRSGRGRDEAVTTARHGLYEARLAGVVTERGAQVADGGLQHRFGDEPVTPDRVEQRVLRQQSVRLARQRAQQAEGGGRERDGLSAAQQPGIRLIQLEVVEPEADRIGAGERSGHAICRAMETGRIIAAAILARRSVIAQAAPSADGDVRECDSPSLPGADLREVPLLAYFVEKLCFEGQDLR